MITLKKFLGTSRRTKCNYAPLLVTTETPAAMDPWEMNESCCACLVTANVSEMYSLSDPETMQLFRECTSLQFQDDNGHLPQHLCIMCYKQCEIWKCFKTRCEHNHRLMGYPSADDEEDAVLVKSEPDDTEYVEQMTTFAADEEPGRSSYDPLGSGANYSGGGKPTKRKKRQKERRIVDEDSEYSIRVASPPKKAKPITDPHGKVSNASHSLYMKTYRDFLSWKTTQGATEINEKLMLLYFQEISKSLAPSTLTNKLSHLVKTIEDFHQVKIDGYAQLRQFCRDMRTRHSVPTSYSTTIDD